MRIEIDIPKEFEEHFKQDKFKDSFERIMADIKHSLENGDCLCAGRYEYETIEMLVKALENSKTIYDVDKVIEDLEKRKALYERLLDYESKNGTTSEKNQCIKAIDVLNEAIETVKQGGVSDDVCEWIIVDRPHNLPIYNTSCGKIRMQYTTGVDIYCNGCGKKIKIVGD